MRYTLLLLGLALFLLPSTSSAQALHDLIDREIPATVSTSEVAGKVLQTSLETQPVLVPFTGIAVQGRSADPGLEVEARVNGGPWRPLRVVPSATSEAFVAGLHGLSPVSGPIEIRFRSPEGLAVTDLEVGTFDNRDDSDSLESSVPDGLSPLPAAASGVIIPPLLITRSDWNAEPFRGSPSPLARPDYDYMTFHHAAGYNAENRDEGLQQLRNIQDLHQNVRGWSDIGYQFVIDRAGNLYQGRPFMTAANSLDDLPVLAMGAHVGGANTGNIGVSLLGCYHPPEGSYCTQEITPEAYATYVTLFAFLNERYGVSLDRIRGHRDFSSTACPGDNNYALLPNLRTDIEDLLRTGNEPLGTALMDASVDASGVVSLSWEFLAVSGITEVRIERWVGEVGTVLFRGSSTDAASYSDAGVEESGTVEYRLYARGADGREQRLASVEVVVNAPTAYSLASVFPNPAADQARFRYSLRNDGQVALAVYDALGRAVVREALGIRDSGMWHAAQLDVSGLPSGTYYVQILVSGFGGTVFEETRQFSVVR